MTTNRIQHKIQVPALPTAILHRKEVMNLLAEAMGVSQAGQIAAYKLILLCAPAGYGKTTLLADTIQWMDIPCSWCSLEQDDTPILFLKMVLTSLRSLFPDFGRHLDGLLLLPDNAQENWDNLTEALVETLHSEIPHPLVLTLCNYHRVLPDGDINHMVNRLLARLPSQVVLVIESRSLPSIELAPLIASRQMFGLGSNKLCFSTQELYELAHIQGFSSFTMQEAEQLTQSFEGWITGILLGSDLGYTQMHPLIPSHKRNWGTPALLADHKPLTTYITKNIFGQEEATHRFLEAVSIFDQLTPERCNALLDRSNAAEQLIYAEQQGLFVRRSEDSLSGGGTRVYSCHPILRELFREHLHRHSFEYYLALQRRAAQIFQQEQAYPLVVTHLLLAQEYEQAIELIISLAADLLEQGQENMVSTWLQSLPEPLIQQHPWLSLIQANLYLLHNEYTHVSPLLDLVEASLTDASVEPDASSHLLLQAELRLARSKLVFYQGEFQMAQELCQQVLDLLPVDERSLRTRTHQRLGVCLIVGQGRIHEGIVQLQQALHLSNTPKEERRTATIHRLLASAYGWIGNYTLADYHQTRTLQIWERLNEPRGISGSLTSMGLLKLRQGLPGEAEEILLQALHWARDICHAKSSEAYALVALGELHSMVANYVQALQYLEEGLRLARECQDNYLTHCSLCSLATTYLFLGEVQTGQFFLHQIFLKEQEEHSYEGLLYHLTQGMILLTQQADDRARQEIEQAVTLGKRTNIQFLHIQALLLLLVCFFKQGKTDEASRVLEQVIALNKKGAFDYIVQVMVRRSPELQELLNPVEMMPSAHASEVALPSPTQPAAIVPPPAEAQVEHGQNLRIYAFGSPKVLVDTTLITRWHMTRSLELFFFLLAKAQPVQKDLLIEALWPNTLSDQIETTLRTAIYYARQALGKASILYRAGCYSLDLPAVYRKQIWYDVSLFENYYREAKQSLEDEDDESAHQTLSNMVALYAGDYLQPFYNDWCGPRRDQLRQTYIDARQQLAFIAWRDESWEESLGHWRSVLAIDACSQKAHYGMMRCYLKQGQKELALRQYRLCMQNLQEELQILPDQSLQKLYQRIIQANEPVEVDLHLPPFG